MRVMVAPVEDPASAWSVPRGMPLKWRVKELHVLVGTWKTSLNHKLVSFEEK